MVISTPLIKAYARLGQKGAAAGIGMLEVAKSDPNLRVVVADSIAIASLDRFYANYPDKVINVGIAEQNMIGIAAGIASESGSNVFACTYAEFIIARTVEMIRQNLSYHQFNVKLIGNSAGFAMETLAVSHWATEDIALVRALPNIIILSASDCLAAIKLVIAASLIKGPVYLRLSGGLNFPIVYEEDCDFTIGKSNIIKKGEDVAILATGLMVREAMDAAEMLKEGVAMGADKGVLLTDRVLGGSDTCATSIALAAALKKVGFDLVIAGRQAIDGDTAQVGPQTAERLDIPQITYVDEILEVKEDSITVKRSLEDVEQIVTAKLPCVITTLSGMNKPRYMQCDNIVDLCNEDKIEVLTNAELGIDPETVGFKGFPTSVKTTFTNDVTDKKEVLKLSEQENADMIAKTLKEKQIITK